MDRNEDHYRYALPKSLDYLQIQLIHFRKEFGYFGKLVECVVDYIDPPMPSLEVLQEFAVGTQIYEVELNGELKSIPPYLFQLILDEIRPSNLNRSSKKIIKIS
jgi:hypothetical protein